MVENEDYLISVLLFGLFFMLVVQLDVPNFIWKIEFFVEIGQKKWPLISLIPKERDLDLQGQLEVVVVVGRSIDKHVIVS